MAMKSSNKNRKKVVLSVVEVINSIQDNVVDTVSEVILPTTEPKSDNRVKLPRDVVDTTPTLDLKKVKYVTIGVVVALIALLFI